MVIVYNTAIRADRDILAGLLEPLIARLCNLDHRSSLTPANSFCLTSDADRTTTDADLDEVGTALG